VSENPSKKEKIKKEHLEKSHRNQRRKVFHGNGDDQQYGGFQW
jgi:hypothetical protein